MSVEDTLEAARKITERLRERAATVATLKSGSVYPTQGAKAEVSEFLKQHAGPKSHFLTQAVAVHGLHRHELDQLIAIMESFVFFVEQKVNSGVPPGREGQLDVVNDMLASAQASLDSSDAPAWAAVIIGAALEQFLRSWAEAENLTINGRPGLSSYAQALLAAGEIDKQDLKNITAWAGLRNHAAHGDWEEVSDPREIRIMLQAVNLFMQQHRPGTA